MDLFLAINCHVHFYFRSRVISHLVNVRKQSNRERYETCSSDLFCNYATGRVLNNKHMFTSLRRDFFPALFHFILKTELLHLPVIYLFVCVMHLSVTKRDILATQRRLHIMKGKKHNLIL